MRRASPSSNSNVMHHGQICYIFEKPKLNATIMSLNHVVEFLTKNCKSTCRFHRAIRLFEFQVSLFYPKAFEGLVASKIDVPAPTKILKTARIFAAIKILEKIEADMKKEKNSSRISIQELAANENYRNIFDGVIGINGGWRRIRHSMSARRFDKNIVARCRDAQFAANIVDFSYRFSKHLGSTRYSGRTNPGGVSAARYVVGKAYRPRMEETSIKNRWRAYQLQGIFLYLMLNQQFNMKPPRVGAKKFLEELLRQADNLEELRRFFCAYQAVRAALLDQKYKRFPTLDLNLQCSPPQLDVAEFSPDIQKAFEEWLNR